MKEYKIVCDIEYPDGRIRERNPPIMRNGCWHYTIYKTYDDAASSLEDVIQSGRQYKTYPEKPPVQRNYVILSREVGEWTL